jgi:hypothetical protein
VDVQRPLLTVMQYINTINEELGKNVFYLLFLFQKYYQNVKNISSFRYFII